MTLAVTTVHQQTSSNGFGSGGFTTSSFTPGARKLVVVALANSQNDDALEGSSLTISDSDSSITSWTSIHATTTNDGWAYGTRAWVSDQAASGGSMTVTIDAGAFSVENYRVYIADLQDFDSIGGKAEGADAGGGAFALTLDATPASTSVILAFLQVALSGVAGTVTENANWTNIFEVTRDDWWMFQGQSRTGTTSTSVDWDNINTQVGTTLGANGLAFELKQVAGGGDVSTALTGSAATPNAGTAPPNTSVPL